MSKAFFENTGYKLNLGGSVRNLTLALGISLFFTACAYQKSATRPEGDSDTAYQVSVGARDTGKTGEKDYEASPYVGPSKMEGGQITILGVKLQNNQFDYPVTINSRVEYWVDYFTGRGRKHFDKYLERSEFFIPYIQPLLKQNNLPEDLVYLAMIESGFNNHARSHAKAVGPWQFISATGKRYGLMVNWWVDERRDTRKSSLAAIEYLRELHSMFQSWELAAAAYNAGEAKIARAIRRYGSKDFWTLTRHRFLRQETRDYVPKIIAAAIVAKNRTQFGFPASSVRLREGEVLAGDGEPVKVLKENEVSSQSGQSLEPANPRDTISQILEEEEKVAEENGDLDSVAGKGAVTDAAGIQEDGASVALPSKEGESSSGEPARPIAMPHVTKSGEVQGEDVTEFEVQSPADLLKVARAAGLSYQTVKALNPDLLRWCTPPTVSTYRIKLPTSVKDRFLQAYNQTDFPKKVRFLTYKVQRGETLSRVANRFGIKVDPITDLNGVSPRLPLRRGVRILLPIPDDRSRTLASLEVRDPPERRRVRRVRRGVGRQTKINLKRRESARSTGRPATAFN